MPLVPPLTIQDLAGVHNDELVNLMRSQAISMLQNDATSLDVMQLADELARRELSDTRARVHYLSEMVRACGDSEQALAKMARVVLPASISGGATRLVVELLALGLGYHAVPTPFYRQRRSV